MNHDENHLKESKEELENFESEEDKKVFKWYDYIINIFISPKETFLNIRKKPKGWVAVLFVALAQMVMGAAMLPKIKEMIPAMVERMMASGRLPDIKTADEWIKIITRQVYINTFVGAIIGLLFVMFLTTLVFYLYFKFTDREGTFKQTWAVVAYSSLINSLHSVLVGGLLYATGFKNVHHMQDFQKSAISFHLFIDRASLTTMFQKLTYMFLMINNPFFIWYLIVLGVGVKVVYKTNTKNAVASVLIFWVLFTGLMLFFTSFQIKANQF